ncbi:hypothetical protein [Pseudoalteromonas rhizosphaerae]|uniref:hypothetical protein n=1 Tax=Pseudoalteromonas rhizosphaerae TaxID=2518973 RepID=UPI00384DA10A
MATLVNEAIFNAYIAAVCKTHRVYANLSIHHGENDTAYQITLNNELVTIGRFDPPSDYLVFDYLSIYKQNDKINTTKRQNVNVS